MASRKVRKNIAAHGEVAFKVVSVHAILIYGIIAQVITFLLSTKASLFPGAETLMSIIGSCAEIIAGLYGITMAGYTFFLSRIDALMASDATLDYVVASIKTRFKHLIWFITFNVMVTLFVSVFLMYCPVPADTDHVFFYRLFCNEFVLSLVFSIALILYYSILVIDPNCLQKEAARLRNRISSDKAAPGSVVEFIGLYDQIETLCNEALPQNVLHQIRENKGHHFEYTIALLQEHTLMSDPLIQDLNRIHRYYECVVNCTSLHVSQEMCSLARHVLAYLNQASVKK